MDPNTIPFYLAASGLSLVLCLLMLGFASFQPGTLAARHSARALFVLTSAFLIAGLGNHLARWIVVVVGNVLIVSAGLWLHTGLSAMLQKRNQASDRLGWLVLALGTIAFWYWGLIEPNGHYRSVTFSLSILIINSRTAYILLRAARQKDTARIPASFLAALFSALCVWMLTRGILLLVQPGPVAQRGENPTQWASVLGYMVLVSLLVGSIFWLEISRATTNQAQAYEAAPDDSSRKRMSALWLTVTLFLLASAAGVYWNYHQIKQEEFSRKAREAKSANDSFALHTGRIINEADSFLRAAREYYTLTRNIEKTETYIRALRPDQDFIEKVSIIDPKGVVVIPRQEQPLEPAELEAVARHEKSLSDDIQIGALQADPATGKTEFHISRSLDSEGKSSKGIIIVSITQATLSSYYQPGLDPNSIATLLGTQDLQVRASYPESRQAQAEPAIVLPQDPESWPDNAIAVTSGDRRLVYKKVAQLPLMMVTSYTDGDIYARIVNRLRLVTLTALATDALIVMLAFILTLLMRQRRDQASYLLQLENTNQELATRNDEQDRFLSMLSHELKTPLSVIRMSLAPGASIPIENQQRASRAVEEIDSIVDRCLQTGRLQHGRIEVHAEPCEVDLLLQQTIEKDRQRISAVIEPLPICVTDSQLLGIILGNLLDNALKYSPPDSRITLTAQVADHADRRGIAIAVGNLPGKAGRPDPERVFEKYYRSPGAHGKTGSGLGLHISHQLAQMIGGSLRYQPTLDAIRFELWIPE